MLEEKLKTLGLSDGEAQIYLAGLELGPSSVLHIARKTGVHRTTVYHILHGLLQKRLFSESVEGKRRVFVAEGPVAIKALLKDKLDMVDTLVDELSALTRESSIKPMIKFHRGLQGVKDVFRASLHMKEKTIYGILGVETLNQHSDAVMDFWLKEYSDERKDKNIFAKLIMPDTDGGKAYKAADKEKYRETRLLPESSYNFPAEIMFYDTTVVLLVFSPKEQFAVSIESAAITMTMRMIFGLCWGQGY